MSKVPITGDDLITLLLKAAHNGKFRSGIECAEQWVAGAEAELTRLRAIVERLEKANVSQMLWEPGEDIVTLNGKPIGCTIRSQPRQEFDRWFPAFKRAILGEDAKTNCPAANAEEG